MEDIKAWLGGILLLGIVFVVTDCTVGKTRYCAGQVRQHVYHPPYTSRDCHTSNGRTTCQETRHSAEYRLLVYVPSPEHAANVETSLIKYLRYPDGAPVTVGERCGRWTGIPWVNWIADQRPDPPADY